VRKDSPLAKTCAKHGTVLSFEVSKRDLPRWVGEQFGLVGAKADRNACRALIEVVGDDLMALASEIEKLAAWAGGEPIDDEAVELLAAPRAEAPVFAVTDSWGGRDGANLVAACELAVERSPDPPSTTIPRVIGNLTRHVGRVVKAQRLAEQGIRPADATKELGDSRRPVHRFVAEKAFSHARNYSREEVEDVLVRLADLDHALKGGSRLPGRLELDRALVELT
jgi:DNA polymerase III subunit delta